MSTLHRLSCGDKRLASVPLPLPGRPELQCWCSGADRCLSLSLCRAIPDLLTPRAHSTQQFNTPSPLILPTSHREVSLHNCVPFPSLQLPNPQSPPVTLAAFPLAALHPCTAYKSLLFISVSHSHRSSKLFQAIPTSSDAARQSARIAQTDRTLEKPRSGLGTGQQPSRRLVSRQVSSLDCRVSSADSHSKLHSSYSVSGAHIVPTFRPAFAAPSRLQAPKHHIRLV